MFGIIFINSISGAIVLVSSLISAVAAVIAARAALIALDVSHKNTESIEQMTDVKIKVSNID